MSDETANYHPIELTVAGIGILTTLVGGILAFTALGAGIMWSVTGSCER